MSFKDKLKDLRVEKNLSQQELSKIIGVSTRTYINYEMGLTRPKKDIILAKLASALGVAYAELASDLDESESFIVPKDNTEAIKQGTRKNAKKKAIGTPNQEAGILSRSTVFMLDIEANEKERELALIKLAMLERELKTLLKSSSLNFEDKKAFFKNLLDSVII